MKRAAQLPAFFVFFIIVSSFLTAGCHREKHARMSNIATLDSLLRHTEDFKLDKLKQIEEIKKKREKAQTIYDRYVYDKLLYENYYTLNADSALHYANSLIDEAKSTGNNEWINQGMINKASLLAATGLLKGALDIMDSINTSQLHNDQLAEYYGQMVYLYSHLGNYAGGDDNHYYVIERLYKDSVMSVISDSHPDFLWYKSWDILGTNQNPDSVINALKNHLDESALNDRQDAKNAYVLARLYEQKSDLKNYEQYMALSAIIDVKIANAEIASLEDLANLMFDNGKGDIDRAYSYINYSLEKALDYPNRTRAFSISNNMERIHRAYSEKIERQQKHTKIFLVLVCVLAAILIVAVINIIFQNKRVKSQSKEVDSINEKLNLKVEELSSAEKKLNEMNQLLKDLNIDLKKKNSELYESNFVKEEYIGYVFKLCSGYIAEIEALKRNIYFKAVKKQWKEIEDLTSDIDMKEELKGFYHSFDTIFLNLYPTFVNDFNGLLIPEKQIILKDGELLNMELRIYALVRLGITDSVKIADFLHCAPQTVYNYRLKTRSRSIYPKNVFLEQVKSIGNFQGKE